MRIIGGAWRGRRIAFPERPDLRPTPDRVRETLFNWLQPHIVGARCLDLFAGSGALGLEALSRGARHVVFVERDAAAADALRGHLEHLGAAARGEVHCRSAVQTLRDAAQPFDLIFLDPPFASAALGEILPLIAERGWLAPAGLVYLENARAAGAPPLPPAWRLLKSKSAGEVGYHLARGEA
ncbi:MAG: 16S rRNA (guanine(966)-N(2))-methyltransferase RsmD [Gammaproteobacteria bacterium]|nr:16S rRNA (guanine(966)-N(2))-methyltransferase RsmD [Gammaproteobacteria bacterium]MDE2348084.1 16S rRNA (guanine(966)-N(2))-methyltransferase RsmD [Gammaproteobacteria bacterium]